MVASGHSATAKQYPKCVRAGLINVPNPTTMQEHGIVAKGDTYEFMEGPSAGIEHQEMKETKKETAKKKEKENTSPGTIVIRTSNGPITLDNTMCSVAKFIKGAIQKKKEAQMH